MTLKTSDLNEQNPCENCAFRRLCESLGITPEKCDKPKTKS